MDRSSITILLWLFIWLAAVTSFLVMTRYLITRLTGLFHERMRGIMESAEYIIRTGQAPTEWSRATVALDPWPYHLISFVGLTPKRRKNSRQLCLRRLELIIEFFNESSMVQGTDTRDLLLRELKARHGEWVEGGKPIGLPQGDVNQNLPIPSFYERH